MLLSKLLVKALIPLALLVASPAFAQIGPGLGNVSYSPSQVFEPLSFIESPEGHGNAAMVQGYLMVIYSSDGGGNANNGGIEFWDVSDPANPVRVVQVDNADTHGLREAHGFALSWHNGRLLLAAQGILGPLIWDVTDPHAITLVSYLDLPGIDEGDYSGGWWLFWQAPYIYLAGVDSGLYIVDASDPTAPVLLTRMQTGELGGMSPAQTFALGNLLVLAETQGGGFATLDISIPDQPRMLSRLDGGSGYSHIFAGDGKILTSGNIPPRAHFLQVTHDGSISELATVGFFFNSGGYGSYQDGYFHSGFSNNYAKFRIDPPELIDTGTGDRPDADEDFGSVLGNLVFVGNDHGTGTALIPHQEAPDTNPPEVVWMHPPSGASGVSLTSRIGLSFSDQIDSSSLGPSTVWIEDESGAKIPSRLSVQMGLVNVAPQNELPLQQTFKVVADGVLDYAGNPAPHFEGTITTGDGSVPMSPTAAITGVDVNIAIGSYALGVFQTGKRVYSDRDYTFTAQHPARFDGQAYIQTANVDRINFLSDFLSFELLAPAEVLVLYDSRASSAPNWLSSFTSTGESVVTTDTALDVYTKTFGPGTVMLGGNSALGSSGAQSMYSVVIIPEPVPCDIDLSPVLTGTVTLSAQGPSGGAYEWRIAGRTFNTPSPSVYLPPGRHGVTLTVTDGPLGATCGGVKIVHRPLVSEPARVASKVLFLGNDTVNVNPDNASITRISGANGTKVFESRVGARPETVALSSTGELWVTDKEGSKIVVVSQSTGETQREIDLGWASAPFGIVFDPNGTAYVSLSATGEVVAIDNAGQIARRKKVVPTARGVTWFDGRLYVTRFISPDGQGEVYVVDPATLETRDVIELQFDPGPDTEASGRGVPNYVAEVQISPDGTKGFVASKKDNIARGLFRDGEPLTFESRVRAIVSVFDVASGQELLEERFDVNDREMIQTTAVSPFGDLLFVLSQGVNIIDVFDLASRKRISQFDVGSAPQGMALDPSTKQLAVYNFLSRSVQRFDVSALLEGTGNAVVDLGESRAVTNETLSTQVLDGKKIFYHAGDERMSRDKYISCASCHLEGDHDGRVWDFTQGGEGLRNTIPLAGRAGTAHGNVHWTANFDEIQDFENDIRNAFGGTGFLSDEDFARTENPLGAPKAGLSAELDALSAYVHTFDTAPPSPHRNQDGTLSTEARRGREVFKASGCAACHGGAAFSDFTRHDVGTIDPSSGLGIGQPLDNVGFDTPTLLGVWDSAPYFHNGSAPTLSDVLDRHIAIPEITGPDRDDLIAYMLSLDSTSLPPEALCQTGPNECVGGESPPPLPPDSPDAGTGSPDGGQPTTSPPPGDADSGMDESGCSCEAVSSSPGPTWLLAVLLVLAIRRARS